MSERIRVDIPGEPYDVVIGPGLLGEAGTRVRELTKAATVALVSDETVGGAYALAVDTALARAGFRVASFTVPPGETSKNWQLVGELCEEFARVGLGRTDLVAALGGGVIGDLAGFAAAVYLRGVGFVQLPTTLLAMVDSSVGGKTGVDLRAGKNLAGAFKQPLLVLADMDTLSSLPEREWLSGIAEVAKSAVLAGEEFFGWLEENAERLSVRDADITQETVCRCVAFKAGVVGRDEKEEGPRECLNYGHTMGHALEKVLGYGTISHGAAVAEGMRFAGRVSMEVGAADATFVKRQDRLLDALGLAPLKQGAAEADLLSAMQVDKKARAGAVRMVLVDGPGLWRCERVDDDMLAAHLAAWASTKSGE